MELPQILTVKPHTTAEPQPESLEFGVSHKPWIQFHTIGNKTSLCSSNYLVNKRYHEYLKSKGEAQ
jgi:hypothetical protein